LSFAPNGSPRWRRLAQGLSMPHTVARGPDGRIYVSEMNRILTLDPDAADPAATVRTVIGDLPDNRLHDNRHPLSSFVFDDDGALLVNVGAPSDRCVDDRGRPRTTASGACADSAETAQVRRHAYLGNGRWAEAGTVFASGLRNSIALVRHSSGTILQGENSVDLTTPDHPYDEINVLRPGGHYGWPYCVDLATPLPGWSAARARCGQRDRPAGPAAAARGAAGPDLLRRGDVPRTARPAADELARLSPGCRSDRCGGNRRAGSAADRHGRALRHLSARLAALSRRRAQRARQGADARLG
ncbi:PQQ-dependent sugar dehydrogenase, partial [Brevundimonas sp.]|uniref:PQQ-dependent sugar dehydrogenase n=1 Tax=Brevundimonas sp. TaxID=1871086 RepID=UPI002898053F